MGVGKAVGGRPQGVYRGVNESRDLVEPFVSSLLGVDLLHSKLPPVAGSTDIMDNMNRAPHEGLSLSLRVFSMPELTRWIHKFSTEQDILALLRVCRHLHSCIIPLVWKTVKNVSVLIDLLPNVQSVLNTEATPSTVRLSCQLSEMLGH